MIEAALFGAGRIGQIHAAKTPAHPSLRLKYVVDVSAASAELAARLGAAVTSAEAALADPEVAGVVIAEHRHPRRLLLRRREAGKAIFCEKPIDLDLARAQRRGGGRARRRACLVGFNRRFDPNFPALKARLAAGQVGALETLNIVSHDPAPPPLDYVKVSGGLFRDMAIHDFDIARWLLDDEPRACSRKAAA